MQICKQIAREQFHNLFILRTVVQGNRKREQEREKTGGKKRTNRGSYMGRTEERKGKLMKKEGRNADISGAKRAASLYIVNFYAYTNCTRMMR